jgi:hypothetical protein
MVFREALVPNLNKACKELDPWYGVMEIDSLLRHGCDFGTLWVWVSFGYGSTLHLVFFPLGFERVWVGSKSLGVRLDLFNV